MIEESDCVMDVGMRNFFGLDCELLLSLADEMEPIARIHFCGLEGLRRVNEIVHEIVFDQEAELFECSSLPFIISIY
jgi:hypothetical protein